MHSKHSYKKFQCTFSDRAKKSFCCLSILIISRFLFEVPYKNVYFFFIFNLIVYEIAPVLSVLFHIWWFSFHLMLRFRNDSQKANKNMCVVYITNSVSYIAIVWRFVPQSLMLKFAPGASGEDLMGDVWDTFVNFVILKIRACSHMM